MYGMVSSYVKKLSTKILVKTLLLVSTKEKNELEKLSKVVQHIDGT